MATEDTLSLDCRERDCPVVPDIGIYSLEDRLAFNGTPLSFIEQCPQGHYCAPGSFPRVFTYPPGTFVIPLPPINTGFPIVVQLSGCTSNVSIVLPPTATQAQVNAAGQQVIGQVAAQQAACDAIKVSGPLLPISIHLSDIFEFACVDTLSALAIHATSSPVRVPVTFTVTNKPAFLSETQNTNTLFLSGTATPIGVYNFSVSATAPGNPPGTGSKSYTLTVVGIATASPLPNGTVGTPYSQTLDASSIPGVSIWSVTSGTLPDGLTLDSGTGEISGTPTVDEASDFVISAGNGEIACEKEFSLTIEASVACAVFETIVWGAPSIVLQGTGAASGTALGGTINMDASNPATVSGLFISDPQSGQINFTGGFMYTGPAINCCYDVNFEGTPTVAGVLPNPSSGTITFGGVYQDGVPIPASGFSFVGIGSPQTANVPFTIAEALVASLIQFTVTVQAGGNAGFGNLVPASNATLAIVIGSC